MATPGRTAEEDPLPLPDAIARARVAYGQQDGETLAALAARHEPDPWLVADGWLAAGEPLAAAALAAAAEGPDTAALAAYVQRLTRDPVPDARRERMQASLASASAGDMEAIVVATEAADPDPRDVPGVVLLVTRGLALQRLRRLPESGVALRQAATAAARLGWLRHAYEAQAGFELALALANLASSRSDRGDLRAALADQELGFRRDEAGARINRGTALGQLGRYDEVFETFRSAREIALEIGDRETEVFAAGEEATILGVLKRYEEASALVHRTVGKIPCLVGRLGDEQAARVGDRWARLFEVGALVEGARENAEALWSILEWGRAGALREALGGQQGFGT